MSENRELEMEDGKGHDGVDLRVVAFFSIFHLLFSIFVSFTHAGGAAAQMKQQRGRQQSIQQQQQMILQKQKMEKELRQRAHEEERKKARADARAVDSEVVEEADLKDILASFEMSSRAWPLVIDREAKAVVVSYYIERFRRQGVTINKSSFFYADMVDSMVQATPDMLTQPLENIIRVLAVLEYDFNNGQDKDGMAFKVLGNREAVKANRQRLGL
ncbi:MAG: hypothetical protein Q8Q08_06050 [Candidatus Omnitrophota bacterium]|nr:hypothetical protein [Candidatus Omnitrophota bacterium]MDZ4242020.1 hypothetical protein [Candidatus Omnitrophota bacterium]